MMRREPRHFWRDHAALHRRGQGINRGFAGIIGGRIRRNRNDPEDYAKDAFLEDVKGGQVYLFYKG